MPSPRTELRIVNIVHCAQLVMAGTVLGIGIYKMFFAKNRAAARTGRWALSVAAKSLMIISYQLLTENIPALHRYASLKAFFILDVLEVGFWIAAIVLTVMGMLQTTCQGISCTLSGVVIGLAAVLAILGLPLVWIAYKHWRHFKANGSRIEEGSNGRNQPSLPMDGRSLELRPAYSYGTKRTTAGDLTADHTTCGDKAPGVSWTGQASSRRIL